MGFIPKKVKVGEFGLTEAFIMGIIKQGTEIAGTFVYGNGTVISGICKLIESAAITRYAKGDKNGVMIGTAIGFDSAEDFITAGIKLLKGERAFLN